MMTSSSCPSDWALERYVLEELPAGSASVVEHVDRCETCRARIAAQRADSAAFLRSPGAAQIRHKLASGKRPRPQRWAMACIAAAALALAILWQQGWLHDLSRSQHASDTEELAVLRFQDEWLQAVCRKDADALDRILADDYTYTDALGAVSYKADDLRRARTPGDGPVSFNTSQVEARLYGDVAIVTGQLRLRGLSRGKTYDAEFRFTDTLARIEGQWRAVAAHVSKPASSALNRK